MTEMNTENNLEAMQRAHGPLLEVKNLQVDFTTDEGKAVHAVRNSSFSVYPGQWARCMASRLFSVFISVIEYPFTYTQAVRLFGSSASLTASPIMMNASTVMASAADG